MSAMKKCKIVHSTSLLSSTLSTTPIDWTLCILCQEHSSERLQCPAVSKRPDVGAGYETLGDILTKFQELGENPVPVNLGVLDEDGSIGSTLRRHNAQWHPSCRLKCTASRLARVQQTFAATTKLEDHPYIRRKASHRSPSAEFLCFFCDKPASDCNALHEAMTIKVTERVKQCVHKLQDQRLIAKLSSGDLVAQDAKYHSKCLVKLYNDSSRQSNTIEMKERDDIYHGLALVELIDYIEEKRLDDESIVPIFKLANLAQLYAKRLCELGVAVSGRIHSTKLKERILDNVPGMHAYSQGRDILMTFEADIGPILMQASSDGDDEAICLSKAARIVRRDLLEKKSTFNGSFETGCQEDAVPKTLVALIKMIMDGTNIEDEQMRTGNQAAHSVAQLIQFNSHVRRRKLSTAVHHKQEKETPLPIYLGMMIHGHTRKRELIDTLFYLGLSISYDRVLDISTGMATAVNDQYKVDNVVCPLKLRKNLFTTAAVDNIDHNPSSTTSHDAFHGTGISLFQHRVNESDGCERETVSMKTGPSSRQIPPLLESYTNVSNMIVTNKDVVVPCISGSLKGDDRYVLAALEEEKKWHERTLKLLGNENQNLIDPITWSAFHADCNRSEQFAKTITSLLPLFPDDSKSAAMIRHSFDVIYRAVTFLNPGQVPVITFDQPLYTIAKKIQWQWPDVYGEDRFVIVLGGLHIEMAAWTAVGDFMVGSGWTEAVTQADITTCGIADSFLKCSHVKRTRHAHQITCTALSTLLHKAYDSYGSAESEPHTFEEWCHMKVTEYPQFQYWFTIMHLESLVLVFVRSIRESNFSLYVSTLTALAPWFFALDRTHYSRWLPIHIRDMATLQQRLPDVANQFEHGSFTVHKSMRPFSAIAIDQAHEQNNALVKEDGGAVGLMQNPKALLRWMVGGPEVTRVLEEFESTFLPCKTQQSDTRHHEHTLSKQNVFANEINALVRVIEEMGNPFMEESHDLLVLNSKDVADAAVVNTVRCIEKLGCEQYNKYVTDRLVARTVKVSERIKRNNLPLFKTSSVKVTSKAAHIFSSLKDDCHLFSRLYIACQTRDGDLDTFFMHENHVHPPSLSNCGKLRFGSKSDLVECLEEFCTCSAMAPSVDVIILDGAAVINMLMPVNANTFKEYATHVFIPYVKTQLGNKIRVDIVWDVYNESSLKSTTREKRGKGQRRRVAAQNKIPRNWQDFLRVSDNKSELFHFLACEVVENISSDKEVYSTYEQTVLCNKSNQDLSHLAPCTHEEADTRMFIHVMDAYNKGHHKLMIRTVDTDVLVLAIYVAVLLEQSEIWIAFGTGTHLRYIPAHDIATVMGAEKAQALPMLHAFTGCDTVSSFAGKGKKTAMNIWKSFDKVTGVFSKLCVTPSTFDENDMATLETFVVLLYDRTSAVASVNLARKHLFCSKGRSIDAIPPTAAALLQHTRRAIYQGGHVWGQLNIRLPNVPSPELWGWQKTNTHGWQPLWSLLPEATTTCAELLRCGCRKGCGGHCKCVREGLQCTALCLCAGECDHNDK